MILNSNIFSDIYHHVITRAQSNSLVAFLVIFFIQIFVIYYFSQNYSAGASSLLLTIRGENVHILVFPH